MRQSGTSIFVSHIREAPRIRRHHLEDGCPLEVPRRWPASPLMVFDTCVPRLSPSETFPNGRRRA